MNLRLDHKTSDIIISIYIIITLIARIYIEPLFIGNLLASFFVGFLAILIIWILVKIKFLNPNWFGLFNKTKK